MPAPMMPPITTIVASNGPSARLKLAMQRTERREVYGSARSLLVERALDLARARPLRRGLPDVPRVGERRRISWRGRGAPIRATLPRVRQQSFFDQYGWAAVPGRLLVCVGVSQQIAISPRSRRQFQAERESAWVEA